MASKPAQLPRWGENAAGTIGPHDLQPLELKKDVGWTPGEEPPAETFNWLQRLSYNWLAYLKDGVFVGDTDDAVHATGTGAGAGVNAFGGATGPGMQALPGGGIAAPVRGSLALTPLTNAPTTPANGDLWTRTTGLFARINGAVWAFAALAIAQTWTALQTFNAGIDLATNRIVNVGDPTGAQDAATKHYVESTPAWTTISSGFSNSYTGSIQYAKDKLGNVRVHAVLTVGGGGTLQIINATNGLPAGSRPVVGPVRVIGSSAAASTYAAIQINADGSIQTQTALTAGDTLLFDGSFAAY